MSKSKGPIKIILYYNSDKDVCIKFIDTIWREITNKYKNINFVEVDVNKNKKYTDIYFDELPKIYMINSDENIINEYTKYLSYNNLDKFIITSNNTYSTIN